jgi:phosphoribosylamine---glycine ligase
MNVLVLGSGGREHAIVKAVKKSSLCDKIYAIPGNPGIASLADCININPLDNDLIKDFCLNQKIDLIIPGSELFLQNGIADAFINTEIMVFGPTKKASMIESSKVYAKDLMKKYDIPTAKYQVFNNYQKACNYLNYVDLPIVIKYNGLAKGKGVVVCFNYEEAYLALDNMLNKQLFGNDSVVIEEYLAGPEFSLMAFANKDKLITMPIAQDHKRLLDSDQGPNTGGMGAYSPVPMISDNDIEDAISNIMKKILEAMINEDNPFTGFLYGGLILTENGPKVIEFNCRFGDPEAEVILPKLESDILEIITNLLNDIISIPKWRDDYYLGVVLASKGYPDFYKTGYDIIGLDEVEEYVYHMGTQIKDKVLKTNGGRVLFVLGIGETLEKAQKNAYDHVIKIKCENLIYRKDIGSKALIVKSGF